LRSDSDPDVYEV